jgi:hypothetical protein
MSAITVPTAADTGPSEPWRVEAAEVVASLDSDRQNGLTSAEAVLAIAIQ